MGEREELCLLADRLPDRAVEKLARIGPLLGHQARQGETEEVTSAEELAIVRQALPSIRRSCVLRNGTSCQNKNAFQAFSAACWA